MEPESLIKPFKAGGGKTLDMEWLNTLLEGSEGIRRNVIQRVILGAVEKDLSISNNGLVTLDMAVKKNKWKELGRLI